MTRPARRANHALAIAAVAALGVLALLPGRARADTPASCVTNVSVTPTARAESQSEPVGDVTLTCSGGTATPLGDPVPTRTLTVFLNTPITSRVLGSPWDDALLLVDEPLSGLPGAPTAQLACSAPAGECSLTGNGSGSGQYDGSSGHPNVFQGKVVGTTVTFPNVPLDATAGARILRITNIRADVSGLPVTAGSATAVTAALAFSGTPTISGPNPTVAFAQFGGAFSTRTSDGSGVLTAPAEPAACVTQKVATLRYGELSGTAFRLRTAGSPDPTVPVSQNLPGNIYSSESGFFNPLLIGNAARGNLGLAGLADFGTRLKAVFEHVPVGAQLFVPTSVSTATPGGRLQLVSSEAGPYSAVSPATSAPAGTAPVTITGGTGRAVWEVVQTNPSGFETLDIPVYSASGTGAGTVTVSQGFAPTAAAASFPRFAGGTLPADLVKLRSCSQGAGGGPASGQPVISGASLTNNRFRVAGQATAIRAKRAPAGTTFRFTLASTSKLQIAITRRAAGRRSGRRCVAPTEKLRQRHAKRCTRTLTTGTLTRANMPAGAGSVPFTGRIGKRALKPRRYRAVLTASSGAAHSKPVTLAFTIVR
jgi:hypothetical protein